jgi:hypothetical protein
VSNGIVPASFLSCVHPAVFSRVPHSLFLQTFVAPQSTFLAAPLSHLNPLSLQLFAAPESPFLAAPCFTSIPFPCSPCTAASSARVAAAHGSNHPSVCTTPTRSEAQAPAAELLLERCGKPTGGPTGRGGVPPAVFASRRSGLSNEVPNRSTQPRSPQLLPVATLFTGLVASAVGGRATSGEDAPEWRPEARERSGVPWGVACRELPPLEEGAGARNQSGACQAGPMAGQSGAAAAREGPTTYATLCCDPRGETKGLKQAVIKGC